MQVELLSHPCICSGDDEGLPILANIADMAQESLVQDAVHCLFVIDPTAWLSFHSCPV